MKNLKKILGVLLYLAAFFISSVCNYAQAEQVLPGNYYFSYTREDIRDKIKDNIEFDYTPYLKGEKKVGFTPDEEFYNQVRYQILLRYVEPVSDKDLLDGVFTEVGRLLKQAGVDSTELKSIHRTGNPMNEIVKAYRDRIDSNIIRLACVRGLLETLKDPHSSLLLPDEYNRLNESMSGGNFSGIGVYIMLDPENSNWLTISEPIEGTPAYKANLETGDVILGINGESTKGQPIDVVVSKIRGPRGTKVTLSIKRKGVEKPFDVSIVRDFIHVNSVSAKLLEKKIGYIKLQQYGSDTGQELETALSNLEQKGAKAIILDLRNNSGGLIDSAIIVCSKFLPRGAPVVTVVDRKGKEKVERATGGMHPRIPLVVLVNELSASASEITAGALRDHKRAVLIGEKTYGKGSVQVLEPVSGSSDSFATKPAALKLTIALFYTPRGDKVNKAGIEPDIKVPMDLRNAGIKNYDKDIQLQKAVAYLQKQLAGAK